MRVFYPISANISDLVNDGADASSGWVMLWSLFCIALLALVLSVLPSYAASTVDQRPDSFSSAHYQHAAHLSNAHAKHNIGDVQRSKLVAGSSESKRVATQEYINAHRCARYVACLGSINSNRLSVAPARPRAGAGQYL